MLIVKLKEILSFALLWVMISFFSLRGGGGEDTLGNSSFTSITGHKTVIGNDSLTNSF